MTLTAPDTAQTVTVTGGKATIAFNVIAPDDVHMDRFGETVVKHTQGHADSGIETQPFLLPDNVSFMNVRYHEVNTTASVTNPGAYQCLANRSHCLNTAAGAPCHEMLMFDSVVAGKGTEALRTDCVYSGDCKQTAPFVPGSITIQIPYEYRVGKGPFRRFKVVPQVSALAADGTTLTSDKAGAHGETKVSADTAVIQDCPDE
ncbi:MAG TPA: hypothetical protein VKE96_29640 [Vicinamibacterales bacterium]|nr:hypothetical protein [Vicinamibacterales bacterium]